ncbi:uncharacterized protein [Lepidochelys kempii]|uniref:uncharacterized protein isoform X1 n=1 Tax=Lepidochelys kempii TaxID=8472 RepID=UPI003C6F6B43
MAWAHPPCKVRAEGLENKGIRCPPGPGKGQSPEEEGLEGVSVWGWPGHGVKGRRGCLAHCPPKWTQLRGPVLCTYKLCVRPCSCRLINPCFTGWLRVTSVCGVGVQDPLASPGAPHERTRWGKRTEGQRMLNAPRSDPGRGKPGELCVLQTGCSERGDFPRVLPGFVGSSSRASPRDSVTWGHQVSGPMEAAPSSQAPCKGSKSQRLQGIEEEPLASPPLDYRQYLYSLLGPERAEYFLSPPALERCRSPGEQGLLEAVGGARAGRRRSHAQDAAGGPVESAAARDAPAGGAAPGCNQPAAGQGAAHRPQ